MKFDLDHYMGSLKHQVKTDPDKIDWNHFLEVAEKAAELSGGFNENVLVFIPYGPSALYMSGELAFEHSTMMFRSDILKLLNAKHVEFTKKEGNYDWYMEHREWPDSLEDVTFKDEEWKFSVYEINANITIRLLQNQVKNAPQDKPFIVRMVNDSTFVRSPDSLDSPLRNRTNKPLTNDELRIFEDFVDSAFKDNEHYRGMMIPGERENPDDFLRAVSAF